MKVKKYKHLSFEDRCVIEEFLNHKLNFTKIANRLGKDRTTISKEVYKNRFLRTKRSNKDIYCPHTLKPPYVCNGCPNLNSCSKLRYCYDSYVAHNNYKYSLRNERSNLHITKEQITSINDVIC